MKQRKSITLAEYEKTIQEFKRGNKQWALFFFRRDVQNGDIEVVA